MAEFKHSPGPWRLWAGGVPVDATGQSIIVSLPDMTAVVRSDADARLVACAPQLLEALKSLVQNPLLLDARKLAEFVIRKVEGCNG